MTNISLYLRDDLLQKLDDYVERAAEYDRSMGRTGRQVTSRSKLFEQLIEGELGERGGLAISEIEKDYGSAVFNAHTMKERLPKATFDSLLETMRKGKPLDDDVADIVAEAMKDWAIEHGATHFTHWFQPLSGTTSEKHDSFLVPLSDGTAITRFSGKELIQREADGSSFPSGGLRSTFEARGYTAWDPTSYAFIKDEVLCIPTAFASYTGEALDKKTPLLRSISAIRTQTSRVLAILGEPSDNIEINMGAEQEFFLIPEKDYAAREDLVLTGRTLFGSAPCKGQELEEHYYGSIRPTVNNFMKELDAELWALGIAAHTKHNEVAPAQHELAPVFTNVNRAIDENLLTMEKMTLLASHYGLKCLLHEKPFEGINGSGKHNNWSISVDGKSVLDPGENPRANLRFLVFLSCIIAAVDDYQELLRMSVASAGNDHRLGANEAPPAIVSIYLGQDLEAVLDSLMTGEDYAGTGAATMNLGVEVLPSFMMDTADRNRTSPFAFTGNKFEFRMPGSNVNLSDCNMILNTAVAHALKEFADALERTAKKDRGAAIHDYVRNLLAAHRRIIFSGNGYAAEWEEEAARRGLANHKTTADALPCFVAPESIALFEEFGVLTEVEVRSRYEVKLEKYNKLINIESRVMRRMVRRTYVPAINEYAASVADGIATYKMALGETDADAEVQEDLLRRLLAAIREITESYHALIAVCNEADAMEDEQAKANHNAHVVLPAMEKVRAAVDGAEVITSRDFWPAPSYNNMLFYV